MIYTLCIALTILSRPPVFSQRAGPTIEKRMFAILESREVLQHPKTIRLDLHYGYSPQLLKPTSREGRQRGTLSLWLQHRPKGLVS